MLWSQPSLYEEMDNSELVVVLTFMQNSSVWGNLQPIVFQIWNTPADMQDRLCEKSTLGSIENGGLRLLKNYFSKSSTPYAHRWQ